MNVTTLMSMMGWSNPKTAMVYVKQSRMTSLSLSLYLTNIQRRNCSNPFPKSPLEKRQALKANQGSSTVPNTSTTGGSTVPNTSTINSSVLKVEELEDLSTQELAHEVELEGGNSSSQSQSVDVEVFEEKKVPLSSVHSEDDSTKKETKVEVTSGASSVAGNAVVPLSDQIATVDPRIAGILQNLQNSGNISIHFHFDGNHK